jgi:hypothetical protein
MATDILEDFEGVGSAGTVITTGNSDFDTVNGSPTVESVSGAAEGSFYMEVAATAAIITGVVTFTARGQVYVEFYYRFASAPAANTYICNAQSGGTIMAQIRHNTDNTLLTRNRTTANSNVHAALSPNTWYRFQWLIGVSAGANQNLTTFVAHSLTQFDTTGNQAYTAGNMDRIALGVVASATLTNNFDFFRTSNSEFNGPAVTDTPVAGSDSASLSEGTSVLLVSIPAVDAMTLTETATETTTSDGTDDATLTESALSLLRTSAGADTGALTDASTLLVAAPVVDQNTLSAEVSAISATSALIDSATQSEAAPANLLGSFAVSDTESQTESPTALQQNFAVSDTATQTDGTTTHTTSTTATDAFVFSESSGLNSGGVLSGSDTNSMTETAGVSATTALTDSFTLTEAAILLASFAVTDGASLAEPNTVLVQTFDCNDSGTLSDASFLVASTAVSGIDSGSQTEGIASLVVNISTGDSASLVEQTLNQISALANDTSSFLEQATLTQLSLNVGIDGSTLLVESAVLVITDEDQTGFTVIKMQYPDLNPITKITLIGS